MFFIVAFCDRGWLAHDVKWTIPAIPAKRTTGAPPTENRSPTSIAHTAKPPEKTGGFALSPHTMQVWIKHFWGVGPK